MLVNSMEIQNNFGKYLDLAARQEIVITKNGMPVARLLGMKETVSFYAGDFAKSDVKAVVPEAALQTLLTR